MKAENLLWILAICLWMASCVGKNSNLEDIAEEVVSKQKGVVIDIEPGQKK